MRFVRSLYLFNDRNPAPNQIAQPTLSQSTDRKRNLLVHIHAWCLMNNHYHLLLSPVSGDLSNISLFMKKLNMGYAKFFNEKYDRSGYLWQGKYRKILIENDAHFLYIPFYIHLNPLDYTHANWREGKVRDIRNVLQQLRNYRWSSFLDYNDNKNFPSIITKNEISDMIGDSSNQRKTIESIMANTALASGSNLIET